MLEFRLLKPDEVEVRVARITGKGVMLLIYKDARVDQTILDETVGAERWQRAHEVINGNLFCNVGIWFERREGYGDWVWKQDVGTESYTEKEKGQASDSFKRACFNWGIGRELYTSPFIFFSKNEVNISSASKGETCYDKFFCTNIEYEGRKIKSVKIVNKNTGVTKTFSNDMPIPDVEDEKLNPPEGVPMCNKKQKDEINKMLKDGVCSKEKFAEIQKKYQFTSSADLTKNKAQLVIDAMKEQ